MNIGIIGATGGIGQHLLNFGLARGHHIKALTRRDQHPVTHQHLRWISGDAMTGAGMDDVVSDVDVVLSALGSGRFQTPVTSPGTQHLVTAMNKAGVRRLAVISSLGVGDSKSQGWATSKVFMGLIVPLVLRKQFWDLGHMEDIITGSDLDACIIRPVGLTNRADGPAKAYSAEERGLGTFISRQSVAKWMLDWAQSPTPTIGSVTLAQG